MAKAIVAALRVRSETILDDIARLMELAGVRQAMDPSKATILKDNISWHFPFPGANTTPWQLEGVIRGLTAAGFRDQVCVQNKTVVTNAFKGEDLNHYVPIFKSYDIPVLYNFRDADMKWVVYKPKASMLVLDHIFPDGIRVPDYFMGKNIVHLPTVKCLSGDTQIVLADGSMTTIRELVQGGFARCRSAVELNGDGDARAAGSAEIMSMGPDGRIIPARVTWLWRTARGGRRVLRIRTRTGRTLTATADHLVFTSEGWRTMDSLARGSRIAAARHIPIQGSPQPLRSEVADGPPPRIPARAGRKYSAAFCQEVIDSYQGGGTVTAIADRLESGSTQPIPRIARYFVDLFDRMDQERRFQSEIGEMRILSSPDLAWDTVVDIQEIGDADVDLYDLTVPDTACFIGNGLIVHNCHIYTTTTGAMKNAFGGLLNTKRHYTHSWIHETLVDLLAIQKEIHSGIFAVMDGTTAGNGPGPRTMFPVVKNWMLASADQVAIDALAAKMMGFDPLSLTYIRLAHERGLGCGDVRDIEVTGDASALSESWGFQVGDNGASRVGDLLWFSPLKKFQNFFFRTPLVNVFIMGSEVYHDYYRWPMRDRRAFETWLEKTEWGQMFRLYAERGTLAPDSVRSR